MPLNQLKNGSKNSLVLAINNYRKVVKKIEFLEKQIKYYETKMFSIGGPAYGTDVRNVSNPYDNKLIYWLDKIAETQKEIHFLSESINDFLKFCAMLNSFTKKVLTLNMIERYTLLETAKALNTTSNKVSKTKHRIFLEWDK